MLATAASLVVAPLFGAEERLQYLKDYNFFNNKEALGHLKIKCSIVNGNWKFEDDKTSPLAGCILILYTRKGAVDKSKRVSIWYEQRYELTAKGKLKQQAVDKQLPSDLNNLCKITDIVGKPKAYIKTKESGLEITDSGELVELRIDPLSVLPFRGGLS